MCIFEIKVGVGFGDDSCLFFERDVGRDLGYVVEDLFDLVV